jgi:hypothetical protein
MHKPDWRTGIMPLMRATAAIALATVGLVASLHGQVPRPTAVTLWASGTRSAPIDTREGVQHDRALVALGVRAAWSLVERKRITLEYAAEAAPLVLATANRAYRYQHGDCVPADCGQSHFPEAVRYIKYGYMGVRYAAFGFGFLPLGVGLRFPVTTRIALTTATAAGIYWFSRPVPEQEAARLNFVAEVGPAIELTFRDKQALALGYRFQHISNAGTAPVNLGLNTHLLTIGLLFRR